MPKRPVQVPVWATDPSAVVVEPTEMIRATGFAAGDRPPAPWVNWMFNSVGQWIDYLRSPQVTNWTRTALVGSSLSQIAADTTSAIGSTTFPRLVATDSINVHKLWISVRGDEWNLIDATPTGSFGTARTVCFNGSVWNVGTAAGIIWWCTPGTDPISPLVDGTHNWTAATLPGGITEIIDLVATPDGKVVAVTNNKILYSTDGKLFVAATTSGGITGRVTGLCYTGVAWLAVTQTGQIFRATDPAGTWFLNGATLDDLTDVLTYGSGGWKLEADDQGKVLAYPPGVIASHPWSYVSIDHGSSWASQGTYSNLFTIHRVRWIDGNWLFGQTYYPYVLQANDPVDDALTAVPIPLAGTYHDISDFILFDGAILAVGHEQVLKSARGLDLAPGTWSPSTGPAMLTDAAYLRGHYVDSTAPTDGQVLSWDGTASNWKPANAGGGGSVTLAGDVTGLSGTNSVVALRGRSVASTAPTSGDALTWNGSAWAPSAVSGGSGVTPFLFRMNPASTAQFGTIRAGGSTTGASISALTDAKGRPFIRFQPASDGSATFVPLLDALSAVIAATGRFRIEMRAFWQSAPSGQLSGVGFNAHASSGVTCYAVTKKSAGSNAFDSVVSGTNENFTTFNVLSTDTGYEWAPLFVDVWLDTASGNCTYTYSGFFTRSDFQQRRKTSLATAGGSALGLYSTANGSGPLDLAELIVYKNERDW